MLLYGNENHTFRGMEASMPGFVAISGVKFYVLVNAVVVYLVDLFTMFSIIFYL